MMRRKTGRYYLSLVVGQLIVFGLMTWIGAANNWFNIWPIGWIVLSWFAGLAYSFAVDGGIDA